MMWYVRIGGCDHIIIEFSLLKKKNNLVLLGFFA